MDKKTRIERLFEIALAKSPGEREAYLIEACGDDGDLRAEVEDLLRAHAEAGSFLEQPPEGAAPTIVVTHAAEKTKDETKADVPLRFLQPCSKPERIGMLGEYEVIDVVGQGGMGIVLRAFDPKLNRIVAIKVLTPELAANPLARRRFETEAQSVAAISHPHVVAIHAVDVEEDAPYFVMEYVQGRSLQQLLDAKGPLELREVLRIGIQIAQGLDAAHSQGVIHRDIKPANILLENGVQRVKISDFGLARAMGDVQMTRTGTVVGTPEYMSPEQAQGEKDIDTRSDLFSLGCVLYAMCTGRSPFRAKNTVASIKRVVEDSPRPISKINATIPRFLITVIDQLLSKKPDVRCQTAAEVADLLEGYLAHLQDPSRSPMPARPKYKQPSRFSRTLVATTACLLLGFVFGVAEAGGVTNVGIRDAIIEWIFPQGVLVVNPGPDMSVVVEGKDATMNISGPGEQRVKFSPGTYTVSIMHGTKVTQTTTVTIQKNKETVVEPYHSLPESLRLIASSNTAESKAAAIERATSLHSAHTGYWQNQLGKLIRSTESDEDMILAAYEVLEHVGLPTPWRVSSMGNDACLRARYRVADRLLSDSLPRCLDAGDYHSAAYTRVRQVRIDLHFHDYEKAERGLREALKLAQQVSPKPDGGQTMFLQLVLARTLTLQGKTSEARKISKAVAQVVEDAWANGLSRHLEPPHLYHAEVSIRGNIESDLQGFTDRFEDALERDNWIPASICGLVLQGMGDLEKAIQHYKFAAHQCDFTLAGLPMAQYWIDEQLLQLLLTNNRAAEAQEFFQKLVTHRDQILRKPHPERAFTRIRLAKAMIANEASTDDVATALDEAKAILEHHTLTPDHVYGEIEEIRNRYSLERCLEGIAASDNDEAKSNAIGEVVERHGRSLGFWQGQLEQRMESADCGEGVVLAAYDVAQYVGPLDANFLHGLGNKARSHSRYRLCKRALLDAHAIRIEEREFRKAAWNCLRLVRLYCDFHDFVKAEKSIREALALAQREGPSDPAQVNFYRLVLVLILDQQGRREEARQVAEDAVAAVTKAQEDGAMGRHEHIQLMLDEFSIRAEAPDVDPDAIIARYPDALEQRSDTGDKAAWTAASVCGLALEKLEDTKQAAIHLKHAARQCTFPASGFLNCEYWIDERLLQLLLRNDRAAEAQEFFEELVAHRDEILPGPHPERAFTRIRLAEAMIANEAAPEDIAEALDKAESLFQRHSIIPQDVYDSIAELRDTAEPAGE